jgi:predicted GTPase
MHIINDFFLLTWNEKEASHGVFDDAQTLELSHNYTHNVERFCDSVAIVLIIHPGNIDAISTLDASKRILNGIFESLLFTKANIQKAQKTILSFLIAKGNLAINQAITKRLERLRKEEIIPYDVSRRLMSFLSLIEEQKSLEIPLHINPKVSEKEDAYHTGVAFLQSNIDLLLSIVEDNRLEERLQEMTRRMEQATFSIGVTGVMNAGKSTMLNALLGEALLGTAVVPETANLTRISYAKEPYAKVNFWNQKEWRAIEESASVLPSIEAFVLETQYHFGESFDALITQEGKSEQIRVDMLSAYTSAKDSDKKCNLVKSVELYTNLEMLKEGVVIVDTPGLDDPIIQREEITLAYLNECDVLIHLMNAAQAATQKDVDFIIDALLYRKVAQLLIVITRIDAISAKELDEVIAYTKMSIQKRLEEQARGALLNTIIEKLQFIPIAGKLALMHKSSQAQEAIKLGYSYEKTGMPALESYLQKLLFGEESQKASLILSSNRKEMYQIALTCKAIVEEKIRLSRLSKEEMQGLMHQYTKEQKEIELFLQSIHEALTQIRHEMELSFKTLHLFAEHKMDALKNVTFKRIVDDVNYERSKYKRNPKEERIAYMVEVGFKEGLLDVVRDYRYEFQKKMETLLEGLARKYEQFGSATFSPTFDAKTFCEEHFSSTLMFKNTSMVVSQINAAIHKFSVKDATPLAQRIEVLLHQESDAIKEKLFTILSPLNERLLRHLLEVCQTPAKEIEEQMERTELMLRESFNAINANEQTMAEALERLHVRQKKLEAVLMHLGLEEGK